MRRLTSQQEQARKERFNKLLIGFILIFIMVLSVIGYAVNVLTQDTSETKVIYNGLEFSYNGLWVTQINGVQFNFYLNPYETGSLASKVNNLNSYYGKTLYIDSEDLPSSGEIYNNLVQFSSRAQEACYDASDCNGDFPVKTCEDNLIIIRESNITALQQEDNCVFITAPRGDLINVTDEFIYKVIEIK